MPIPRRANRRAFTLVEAMIATSITVMAGTALMLGVASSLKTTNDVLDQALAAGIAQQLMDEIAGQLYCQDPANPYPYPLSGSAYELAGVCRERFNDIGDYNGFSAQPPKDRFGAGLGTDDGIGGLRDPNFRVTSSFFANWQETVSVYYVSATNQSLALSAGQTSNYQAAEVKIYFKDPTQGTRLLASLRRVFTYVPAQ
jgi:type II secretory pathway pseudopilin PulG